MSKQIELIIIIMLLAIMAEIYLMLKPKRKLSGGPVMLVDTSVLMDGRVIDLAKTGFLLGKIVVPRSVLAELQLLADGSDHIKRERARFGMDVMKELKEVVGSSFILYEDERLIPEGVDNRLLSLAREMNAAILTLDYNLNKVAQVEGLKILNINELAKSLRMSYLPGDELDLELTQKGQDAHQAVGYLSDGTMVVVEQAKKFIGSKKHIEIVRSLQTDAGKMMFAKVINDKEAGGKESIEDKIKKRVTKNKPASVHRSEKADSPIKTRNNRNKSNEKTSQVKSDSSEKTTKPVRKTRQKTSAQREAELIDLANR